MRPIFLSGCFPAENKLCAHPFVIRVADPVFPGDDDLCVHRGNVRVDAPALGSRHPPRAHASARSRRLCNGQRASAPWHRYPPLSGACPARGRSPGRQHCAPDGRPAARADTSPSRFGGACLAATTACSSPTRSSPSAAGPRTMSTGAPVPCVHDEHYLQRRSRLPTHHCLYSANRQG